MCSTGPENLRPLLTPALADRAVFEAWFAAHVSQPKYDEIDWRPEQPMTASEVTALLAEQAVLSRNPASQFAFTRQQEGSIVLFADGQQFACIAEAATIAEQICAEAQLQLPVAVARSKPGVALITALINQGSLAFEDEE